MRWLVYIWCISAERHNSLLTGESLEKFRLDEHRMYIRMYIPNPAFDESSDKMLFVFDIAD